MAMLPPLLFSSTGPIATPPATLQAELVALVEAAVPGYTADLPGSLIDDVVGTDVGALVTIDQARVDAVNNVTPYGANAYILAQLGQQFGLSQGLPSNGNVDLVFAGTPGYVLPPGFLCSDGTNQYSIQDGGVVQTDGYSAALYAVATNSNTFAIPANSVTEIVTSVPSPYTLTVTNPVAGIPAQAAETIESYRSRLLQAYQVAVPGTQTYLKTLLRAVAGVSQRLISVIQNGTSWEVICGGGDPYAVGQAIYSGVSNVGYLVGSSTTPRNINVTLYDAPNSYNIVYVNPPQQIVTVAVTWNTTLANFTAALAVNQYIIASVQSYINGIVVGQPINLLVMTENIQQAIASVLAPVNLTTLTFDVTINSVPVTPSAGTSIIPSDPESYFYISPTGVTSNQG